MINGAARCRIPINEKNFCAIDLNWRIKWVIEMIFHWRVGRS